MAYRGNLKRRGEIANKEGAVAKLFISDPDGPGSPLELSFYNSSLSNTEQDEIVSKVRDVLGHEFGWRIGSGGWNRP